MDGRHRCYSPTDKKPVSITFPARPTCRFESQLQSMARHHRKDPALKLFPDHKEVAQTPLLSVTGSLEHRGSCSTQA